MLVKILKYKEIKYNRLQREQQYFSTETQAANTSAEIKPIKS